MIDYAAPLFPAFQGDRMLAAICTGVIAGFGYAIIFMRGSSTGGTDFIVMAVKVLRPHMSLGKIVVLADAGVDMRTKEPVEAAMGAFERSLSELEELLADA